MLTPNSNGERQTLWADRLRNYRIRKNCTQSTLAASLGVTQPQVSRWESAGSFPSSSMQAKIVRTLELIDELEPWHDVVSFLARTAAIGLGVTNDGCIRCVSLGFQEASGIRAHALLDRSVLDVFDGDLVDDYRNLDASGAFKYGFLATHRESVVVIRPQEASRRFQIRADHWSTHDRDGKVMWACLGALKF
ncbi:helix-turn-helix transcriptional regulator [Maricaulis sp.]|jgi:transcriptional regulator with XRE-family HTH domain|uniref:helix-turn-helix domain-containing protein n=1 Tax=Maricaulis sp. TaxID=1486257 RepID=UPI000C60D8BF|nr:hypothetical protein [Maricaulis sp.]